MKGNRMKQFNQEMFNNFIKDNGVYGFFPNSITLASGRKSYFYANWRNVVEDVYLTNKLAQFVLDFVDDKGIEVDTFYGIPDGATKIGIITQNNHALRSSNYQKGSHVLSMGRKTPKDHGALKDRYFVGAPRGKTLVLEDVTTTGGSAFKNVLSMAEANIDIVGVISLTNRMQKTNENSAVSDMFKNAGFDFYSMSTSLDMLPIIYDPSRDGEALARKVEKEFDQYGVNSLKLL